MDKDSIRANFLGEMPKRIIDGSAETYTEWLERKLISVDKLVKEKCNLADITNLACERCKRSLSPRIKSGECIICNSKL